MRSSLGVLLGLALLGAACDQRSREQSANREVRARLMSRS
jgi:hypothetical protein